MTPRTAQTSDRGDVTDGSASSRAGEPRGGAGPRRWLLGVTTLVVVGLLGVVAVGFAFHRVYAGATIPSEDELAIPDPTLVVDRDGVPIQTLEPAAVRENVSVDRLPDHVPDAVLAAEDRGFYDHRGFSVRGIARAAWANLAAGEVVQGASTIHQQYVAMAVADIEDSYPGKFREVAIAARLDDEFSKDRILEMYLNSVPFGRSAYGIQAAARTYFDVDAVDLDLEQAATLAGMIAAPTAFDPERNPEGASARRDFVLGGMVELGVVDRATAEEHLGSELPELRTEPLFSYGPEAYFLDVVRDELDARLETDPAAGLTVHTTLDPQAQRLAHETLVEHVADVADSGALVTIESATGAVRALLGGTDYATQQFNVATDGRRQTGSSFKTFALAELVDRGYDPDDSRVDAPREYEVGTGPDTTTFGNHSGRGHGEVSVREATRTSINTAYVLLSEALGHDRVVEMSQRLGIRQEITPVPSSVLGTADLAALEVTAAYATLGAEGVRNDPYLIERVETHEGELLFEHEAAPEEVLDANTAAVVTDVLVDVVERGTGTAAAIGRPVAGKTGTTNDHRDAWFVGYTPQLTTSVWVGNRDNTPMDGVTGGSIPAAVWGAYMGHLVDDARSDPFPAPDTTDLEPFDDLAATEDEEDEPAPTVTHDPEPVPEPVPEPEGSAGDTTREEDMPEPAEEEDVADDGDDEVADDGDGGEETTDELEEELPDEVVPGDEDGGADGEEQDGGDGEEQDDGGDGEEHDGGDGEEQDDGDGEEQDDGGDEEQDGGDGEEQDGGEEQEGGEGDGGTEDGDEHLDDVTDDHQDTAADDVARDEAADDEAADDEAADDEAADDEAADDEAADDEEG
jgi:penicillin-binding protein 1A